jgi:hypothetical protein
MDARLALSVLAITGSGAWLGPPSTLLDSIAGAHADAARRRQASLMEARAEDAERKVGEARRAAERSEQRADRAERSGRAADALAADLDRRGGAPAPTCQ